jgi:GNAT superfamily N-acetyltransferase
VPFGIVADDEFVGFAMLTTLAEQQHDQRQELQLSRLLIDRRHQLRGIGTRALDALMGECCCMGSGSLIVRWTKGRGSPRAFFEQTGFVPTDNHNGGKTEARLVIDASC